MTNTADIDIYKENDAWHIRDYGRGIQSSCFTQNENPEKLASEEYIGKFGVGLKDALAVFHRSGCIVEINSKHTCATIRMVKKSGFEIETLHAVFAPSKDSTMEGSDFSITNILDEDMELAKSMFLIFNGSNMLESTGYGDVYSKDYYDEANIYINGVLVAKEPNFLFSYNITKMNAKIKKALNRERSNVSRSAYTDTVIRIIASTTTDNVIDPLIEEVKKITLGTNKEEVRWKEVAGLAAKKLNEKTVVSDSNEEKNVVFVSSDERNEMSNQQVEILEKSGKDICILPNNVLDTIKDDVNTFEDVQEEYNNSFEYKFIDFNDLTKEEQQVFEFKSVVIDFLNENKYNTDIEIKISENLRADGCVEDFAGVYSSKLDLIVIRRSTLQNKATFLGVLIHEFTHFFSGYTDNTRDFETVLTVLLGKLLRDKSDMK